MKQKYLKLAIAVLVFAYCLNYFHGSQVDPIDSWHLIDSVDLLIHEAGHVIFSFFGDFMHILGGSLFQCLFPAIFVGYFIFQKKYFSAAIIMNWVGINLINTSVYIGDAVRRQLPLLTGNKDDHDWNQLLFRLGWLHYTDLISRIVLFAGMLAICSAFIWAIYLSLKTGDQQNANG